MTVLEHLNQVLLPSLEHFRYLGYWVAFFAALLETTFIVGLFLPGSSVILLLGMFAAGGYLDFGDLIWFAVAGAVLGDNLNFWLGQRFGQHWTKRNVWFLRQGSFDHAQIFFNGHGARSVFLGRFVPTIKELIPFVAGTVNMSRRSFMLWNILGAIGWAIEWLGAGYLFARSISLAQLWLSRAGLILVALFAVSLFLLWFRHFVFRYGRWWLQFALSIWQSVQAALVTNPEIMGLVARYPRLFAFLSARLDRQHFSGLPVTLSGFAFFYVLALFGGIVEDQLSRGAIVAMDHNLAQVIATLRTASVVQVFIWVTELGSWQVLLPVTLITIAILWIYRRPGPILGLLVSMTGSMVFTTLGKIAFHRPRPIEAVLVEPSFSFPSGHATIAVAFYGFVGYLLIRRSISWRRRVNWFFVALVVVLLIGLSRLILGVHYLSDVWCGYLVGTLWLIIGVSLSEWFMRRGRVVQTPVVGESGKHVSMGLIAVALGTYVGFASWDQPKFAMPSPPLSEQIDADPVEYLQRHAPAYTETAFGQRQFPLGLVLIAPDVTALKQVLHTAGWSSPGRISIRTLVELMHSDLNSLPLPPAFWNARIDDFSVENTIVTEQGKELVIGRFWDTRYVTQQGRVFVAVVEAFRDTRWGILPRIDPDLDAARDALVASLQSTGQLTDTRISTFVGPMVGKNLMGDSFFSRGKILEAVLNSQDRR